MTSSPGDWRDNLGSLVDIANCSLCSQLSVDLDSSVQSNHSNSSHSITQAEAYGYGFLMVSVISLLSLLGIFVMPFLQKKFQIGPYILTLLISMGVAALTTDALVHLIPNALNLHSHDDDDKEESHGMDERKVIWKMCAVLVGAASFFLLELLLHTCSAQLGHRHSHSHGTSQSSVPSSNTSRNRQNGSPPSETSPLVCTSPLSPASYTHPHSPTCTHGMIGSKTCSYVRSGPPGLGHPKMGDEETGGEFVEEDVFVKRHTAPTSNGLCAPIRNITPLAWVIIIGDGMHNFTDGLAVGTSISNTLGLGLSTALAILFHEIPHELSDYAILLHTGMSWYKALLVNFLSALTAVAGFFVGVTIGTRSDEANSWLLALIAGQFLYIAFVDLLPEIVHSEKKGSGRVIDVIMTFIGMSIGFAVLFLIALFEDSIDFSL